MLYTTICAGREVTADGSFVPLTVNYSERFSAAGRTAGQGHTLVHLSAQLERFVWDGGCA
jgi:hypothetical protein